MNKQNLVNVVYWFLIFFFYECNPKSNFKNIFVTDEKVFDASAVIHHFLVKGYEKNQFVWELKGKKAYVHWDKQNIFIFKPRLKYINKQNYKQTHIRGEEGELTESKGVLFLKDNVNVRFQNGKSIFTEYLQWYHKKNIIKTSAPVKIIMPNGSIIQGIGLQIDMRLEKIKLTETIGEYYLE